MQLPMTALLVVLGATTAAVKDHDLRLLGEYSRDDIRVTSLCIEGHLVLVAHSDVGKGGGLQMLQLQHEVDGKIVPMKCDPKQGVDPEKSSEK